MKKEHSKLVLITTVTTSGQEDRKLNADFGEFKEKGGYTGSTKSAKGSIPALVIHGPGVGTLKWIAGPTTPASRSGSSAGSACKEPSKGKPLKERRKLLDSKRWQQVLRKLVELVKVRGLEQIPADYLEAMPGARPHFVLMAAAHFGTIKNSASSYRGGAWDDFYKKSKQAEDLAAAETALWAEVRPVLAERLTYNGPITQVPKWMIEEAKVVAMQLGIDIDELYAEQVKAIPEPNTWKNLNANGTPKKVTKKKTKKAKV